MLGRQQIAGTPNALSELFKNAHDAYASNALVDYFEDVGPNGEGFLVVRDDGIGMTKSDFENKWLVLGTESKAGTARTDQYRPQDAPERPITGEKGIGRLAVALLGRQCMILTRAARTDGLHDLVVGLVHWGLFEIPGLDLEAIDIPVANFSGGSLPSSQDIANLREQLKACVRAIFALGAQGNMQEFLNEIDSFDPDPIALDSFFASRDREPVTLTGNGSGTHFFIGPSNPIIKLDLAHEVKEDDYSFRKQLLGFTDTVFGENVEAVLRTGFRRWLPGDVAGEDILDPETFFTRTEFQQKADHMLDGRVDEFGQFKGSMRVYEKTYEDLTIPWAENSGRPTRCGPFSIRFGYLMGRASESLQPVDEWARLNYKLDHVGGLYVYRDRIRILPYGDYSFDWLDVEKRRTKSAAYYFFSYRRMFGAVLLTRNANSELQEKAGREGFQQNEAYKQIRQILVNLLLQLTAEFFRKGGANAEIFEQVQSEIRRRSEALERQQKRASSKRKNFASALATFFHETSSGLGVWAAEGYRRGIGQFQGSSTH